MQTFCKKIALLSLLFIGLVGAIAYAPTTALVHAQGPGGGGGGGGGGGDGDAEVPDGGSEGGGGGGGGSAKDQAQQGVDLTGDQTASDATDLVKTAVLLLSYIVGVASVIMLIIGGLKYITSNGDSSAVASAKNTIMFALVGLIIAIFAQAIVQFVLSKAKNPGK